MNELTKIYLPEVHRNSVVTNEHFLKSFMEKMGIYEHIPFDEKIDKVKEHWPALGHHIEEIFERNNEEYLEYKVLAKRVKMENDWPGDEEDRTELEKDVAAYREKVHLTATYITDAYRELYFKYPANRVKGTINWEQVDSDNLK